MSVGEHGPAGPLGLADFITALRGELGEAQRRAKDESDPLKLAVGPIELELDIAYQVERSGEASAGVRAKFWVLEFGEAGVKGALSSQNTRTQHLKLTLTPRLEQRVVDDEGHVRVVTTAVDVHGAVEATEAPVVMPPVDRSGG